MSQENLEHFASGAKRSGDCKTERWDLISPLALRRLAAVYDEGAKKYGEKNWELGMGIGGLLNHAIRHCYLYLGGDDSEDHLSHALWNLAAAVHSQEMAEAGVEPWAEMNKNHRRHPGCVAHLPPAAVSIAPQHHDDDGDPYANG
jgi:hypothetical protein